MRPPSRQLAPWGLNRRTASPRQSGGGVRGPEPPPLSPHPPPAQERAEPDPGGQRPRKPPGEAAAPRKGDTAAAASAAAHQAPPVNRPHAPALLATDRPRNSGAQDSANEAAHSEAGLGKAGARTRATRSLPPSLPPPRRTDRLAAVRGPPDAHGRAATPTARVYPGGVPRRQRMAG